MSLDSITSALENFDLGSMLPDLFEFLSSIQGLCTLVLIISPLVLLLLGLWYLFLPRKEVGKRSGFCTYFGMGSEAAWFFTQKIAGMVWGGLGLILLIIMAIVAAGFSDDMSIVTDTTKTCMIWQIVLVGLSWLALHIVPGVFYDKAGKLRHPKKKVPEQA